jgi:hypothetical protein
MAVHITDVNEYNTPVTSFNPQVISWFWRYFLYEIQFYDGIYLITTERYLICTPCVINDLKIIFKIDYFTPTKHTWMNVLNKREQMQKRVWDFAEREFFEYASVIPSLLI